MFYIILSALLNKQTKQTNKPGYDMLHVVTPSIPSKTLNKFISRYMYQ